MKTAIPPANFVDLLLDAVCVVDRDGYVRYVSAASERVFGYQPHEMVGRRILDFVHPADKGKTRQAVNEILQGELKPNFENRYVRKDGSIAHIMWSARWSEEEQIRVAVARDVTERRRSEAMQAAMYAISEAANSPANLPAMYQRIHKVVDDLLVAPGFMDALAEPNGEALNIPDTEKDRELLEFVRVQVAAAVERKQMHSQLEFMANYDQLTGLPNRRLFMDRIHKALERAARDECNLAVLYLDLNNFKEVNDAYGHSAGDEVLRVMAERLAQCVRAADTVGRLGGDEFIVLLDTIAQSDDAFSVAEKVRASLSEPYELSMASLTLIPSIGIAVYPEHGKEPETLICHADGAMYRVKKGER
ncbi:diguanylate cyclase [Marinobacter panjinensis]|uniref:Diguanylate cyclase n=1 Tax=Marinobacter panjinensis TaxID=2576384 RepID=A0A4U6QTW8_9GAMM|nr:sensor domain-containing diguanylate cyclase [Marinobacter panjinensis]MCR8915075.1 sensor domain-containing diguanylate cyclase [Marinobacter panjinensis]TKV64310.1 diguanylate cyclase [Marinobacter panjinensis]